MHFAFVIAEKSLGSAKCCFKSGHDFKTELTCSKQHDCSSASNMFV